MRTTFLAAFIAACVPGTSTETVELHTVDPAVSEPQTIHQDDGLGELVVSAEFTTNPFQPPLILPMALPEFLRQPGAPVTQVYSPEGPLGLIREPIRAPSGEYTVGVGNGYETWDHLPLLIWADEDVYGGGGSVLLDGLQLVPLLQRNVWVKKGRRTEATVPLNIYLEEEPFVCHEAVMQTEGLYTGQYVNPDRDRFFSGNFWVQGGEWLISDGDFSDLLTFGQFMIAQPRLLGSSLRNPDARKFELISSRVWGIDGYDDRYFPHTAPIIQAEVIDLDLGIQVFFYCGSGEIAENLDGPI